MKTSFFDPENWREIGSTLARNKTRTFMTAFGIFWGTAILALLIGGSTLLKGFMSRNFEGFATNVAIIFPGRTTKAYAGYNKGMPLALDMRDVSNFRRVVTQMEHSTAINNLSATVNYGQNAATGLMTGVEEDFDKIFEPVMYQGRFINQADVAGLRKVCVLGRQIADGIFTGLTDEEKIGKEVSINGIYYKVVGIAGQTSEIMLGGSLDESVVVPHSTMRSAYNLGTRVDYFMMTFKPQYSPADYEATIRRLLAANHPIDPEDDGVMYYFDVSEQFKLVDNVFLGITLLAIVVGAGTLISGIIGVGNIMWIIVRERTHEIGIRRAIGAKPRDIIIQILSESMVLTTVAGIAGIVFAVLVLGGAELAVADGVPCQLRFGEACWILATFLVLGTAAGVIPALKAMKIKPIEAINEK